MKIDVTYNFQAETEPLDADKYSKTLQEYHRLLWSKPLPSGKMFELSKIGQNRLYHKSELGEFSLSSDRAIASFSRWKKLAHIIEKIPNDEIVDFRNITNTIGGIMIWPANRINFKTTINGERGFNRMICDRLDLTIECIRRYYLGVSSPLSDVFSRYSSFFSLFDDLKGYIDFFLLQDAVSDDYTTVMISPPFDNFATQPIPKTVEEYFDYMNNTMKFVKARNNRIEQYSLTLK